MKIDDVLTLIGFIAVFLGFFMDSVIPGIGILFVPIVGISILSGIVIRSRRTLRELKDLMKGDGESNKNQDDN